MITHNKGLAQLEMPDRKLLQAVNFSEIQNWADDNHDKALSAFKLSSVEILKSGHGFKRAAAFGARYEDWLDVCNAAMDANDGRLFFERHFVPYRVQDPLNPNGLFTGYYEPEAEGSMVKGNGYDVPIYRKPNDLIAFTPESAASSGLSYGRSVGNKPAGYHTRQEIESGALDGRGLEIVWLKSWVDAFFIHIQGSGRVRLPNGEFLRLAYAAKNGQAYTGIGSVLLAQGVGTPKTMSMQLLRTWMSQYTEQARTLMWNNKSFIFFRQIEVADENLGALGAQQVNLTPQRSLAVDRSIWMFGTPIWLDTTLPPEVAEGDRRFQHLMIAQDTGTAIRGHVRGDIYWGWGEDAAFTAGHMKSTGAMTALLPRSVIEYLGLKI